MSCHVNKSALNLMKPIRILSLAATLIVAAISHAQTWEHYTPTVTYTPYGGSSYYVDYFYPGDYYVGGEVGSGAKVTFFFEPGHTYRMTGEFGTEEEPSWISFRGGANLEVDSDIYFSWEGEATYFTIEAFFNGIFEVYGYDYYIERLVPASDPCDPSHADPPKVVCPNWWNSSTQRYQGTNCYGYAINEARWVDNLGDNAPLYFNGRTPEQAGRDALENDGFTYESALTNNPGSVNGYNPAEGQVLVAVFGTVQGPGGNFFRDFHLIRKDRNETVWSNTDGSAAVTRTLPPYLGYLGGAQLTDSNVIDIAEDVINHGDINNNYWNHFIGFFTYQIGTP